MKEIFVYTIQHTGTRFTAKLLETAASEEHVLSIPDAALYGSYGREVEHAERYRTEHEKSINSQWFQNRFYQYMNPEELCDKKLVVARGHHIYPAHWNYDAQPIILAVPLYYALQQYKPEVPVVTPMRDPLLSIHTVIWRRNNSLQSLSQENSSARTYYAYRWAKLFLDMLRLPDAHRQLFPIDLPGQEERAKQLFNYCNLDLTQRSEDYINKWKATNTTPGFMDLSNQSQNEFDILRARIVNKDDVSDILEEEMDVLYNQQELKQRLQDIGYRNLSWF